VSDSQEFSGQSKAGILKNTVDNLLRADEFLERLALMMREVSLKVISIYHDDSLWNAQEKEDKSPITTADLQSHEYLSDKLESLLPGVPIISEEGEKLSLAQRSHWPYCWLIDPLDGTKEFINRSGEFSINVALLQGGQPILGALAIPVQEAIYIGVNTQRPRALKWAQGELIEINASSPENRPPVLALSRRDDCQDEHDFAQKLSPNTQIMRMGAATKFGAIAEGLADIYVRFSPVCEWDVAAGHALIAAMGGEVYQPDGTPLLYNQRAVFDEVYFCASLPLFAENAVSFWSDIIQNRSKS